MSRLLTEAGQSLALDIIDRRQGDGRLISRVPLAQSHIQMARDETWLHGLRVGVLPPECDTLKLRVLPGEDRGGGRLAGYTIELSDGVRTYRRHFSIESLASVARQKVLELAKQETAALDDTYNYYLTAVPAEPNPVPPPAPLRATSRSEPLVFETASLADFLANSELLTGVSAPPQPPAEPFMYIFVGDPVWDEGRRLARRGDEVESAGLFSGRLFRDTASPDVFLVYDACLPAEQAIEEKLSVTFTGETWGGIRERLETRRRRLRRPHEILVASVHAHPFKPSADAQGRRTCEACALAQYCSRSSAVPSADDWDWNRAVFAGQPWATLLIHGFNAREQEDWRLYGIDDGQFRERTLRRLKE